MPTILAAAGLEPTDSRSSPNAVRRIKSHTTPKIAANRMQAGRDQADVADA